MGHSLISCIQPGETGAADWGRLEDGMIHPVSATGMRVRSLIVWPRVPFPGASPQQREGVRVYASIDPGVRLYPRSLNHPEHAAESAPGRRHRSWPSADANHRRNTMKPCKRSANLGKR